MPVLGLYNPHYEIVSKSSPKWEIGKLTPRGVHTEKTTDSQTEIVSPELPKKNLIGYVTFASQTNRKSIQEHTGPGPHEKRFEPFNALPEISTNYKKMPVISLEKTLGRSSAELLKTGQTALMYKPGFSCVEKRELLRYNY